MPSPDIASLRSLEPNVLCVGSHPATIQAILDFDFLAGRKQPSVTAIVASGRKNERYFFGKREVAIPVFEELDRIPDEQKANINLFISLVSGRRVLKSTLLLIDELPGLIGGVIFAERVPERHVLQIYDRIKDTGIWIAGGASVGLVVPGSLKLGAIGGVEARQFDASNLFAEGQVAVVSSSGGMVNEVIRTVANAGWGVSFALAVGGERFPMTSPREAMLAAEADPNTKAVAYFGELGGGDEYEIVELIESGQLTKPVVAYIAGTVAELFDTPPQFGHAKAMAGNQRESASAKRAALKEKGVKVGESYADFVKYIKELELMTIDNQSQGADALLAVLEVVGTL